MSAVYGQHCLLSPDLIVGLESRIGNFVFIRDNTVIGKGCLVGSYVDIEGDVRIGNFVALQSGCYLTRGVIIEDEVFFGPRVVTLNDKPISYRRPSLTFNPSLTARAACRTNRRRGSSMSRYYDRRECFDWSWLDRYA